MTETSVTALTSSSAGHLFARTNAGVFRSIDYGDSWDDVNVDLSAVMDVRALAVNAAGHLYKSVFTPNGWADGVYFYRIEAGEFAQTKKLTLLK